MLNVRKILRYWGRLLRLTLLLTAGFFVLAFLAAWLGRESMTGWQLGARPVLGLIPVALVIGGAFILSVSFMKALYDLDNKREAIWYVMHRLFGRPGLRPWLIFEEGKLETKLSNPNTLFAKIGGPGGLIVRKDTAVVLERAGRLTRVVGPGFFHLDPFERVYDTVSLQPMRREFAVGGMSKEGVPVTCETDIRYQIESGERSSTADTPYPANPDAVLKACIGKWIREAAQPKDSQVIDWQERIILSNTEGTLRNILARYPLDRLIAPKNKEKEHPRQAIRRELEAALRSAAPDIGIRILSVKLGQIKVRDEVTQQWIDNWQAAWNKVQAEYQAEAEAARIEMVGTVGSEALVKTIRETTNVLYELTHLGSHVSDSSKKVRLLLMLRNISVDPFTMAFLPEGAMKLIPSTANLPPPEQLFPGEPEQTPDKPNQGPD